MPEVANAHRIPVRGIAVPIRDETTGDSLFNVNLDCHEAEWDRLRRNALARDFMVIGHVFHVMMRGLVRGSEPLIELPCRRARSMSCAWRPRVTPPSATALKLGISPHSVRVHLTLARRRLKARNTAEAVAIALTRGLLT